SLDESFVVIHFRNLEGIDFPWLLAMLQGSFISHINTLVVPGGQNGAARMIELVIVSRLLEYPDAALWQHQQELFDALASSENLD
ncbi:hypothetical protein MJM95_29270, partial [Salmonella enterica subsp. enterica serovar Anatum]|nr:hypothetical protein [Salmonella enterica subsp. enterica serovar Anatum]